ncbi:MAG: rod shape-determining protein MreD [Eubacterium sp.]|nr:rod shape-determining protein MreD [Eubacterium sp.]
MIKRRISTIVIIFIGFILQTTALHAIELADVVPNILLILTVCYSYMRGRTSGLLTGFLCGLLLDMQFGNVIGLYAFVFMTIGFLCGYCQKIYFTDNYILPCVLVGISDLFYGIYYYVTEFLVRGRLYLGFAFTSVILPEIIYTLIVSVLIFRLLNILEKFLSDSKEEV